jgi:digeranylgeranylglycerophospholipid reductase
MKLSSKYDIIIVGAGPAGLSAAIESAKNGIKVVVFEKSKEIGFPIHTSGASWVDELEKIKVPTKFIHPIKIVEFIAVKKKAIFNYKNAVSCVIDVRGYYQYLAEQASQRGADIFVNSKVLNPIISNNFVTGVNVKINGLDYNVNSNIVIDASGFNALIARKIGLFKGFEMYGNGAEYDLYSTKWNQEKISFLFNKDTPAGYGWVFPHGNNRVRVGVGLIYPISKESPIKCLDDFLAEKNEITSQLGLFSRIEMHRGIVPNDGFLKKTIHNGLIVVGDAAGQVSAIAGEGIRYAVDIGKMAGIVSANSIKMERYDEKYLTLYERMWRNKYEKSFSVTYELNKRLRSYSLEEWNDKIEKITMLKPELMVDFLKGNFSASFFSRVILQQPSLIGSFVYRLLKRKFNMR